MVWSWFPSEKKAAGGEAVGAVGFLQRVVAVAMGCFFGCFGIKDSQIVAPPEPVVSRNKNALSSLFVTNDDSLRKGEEGQNHVPEELDVKALKDEAKYLKACGTLLETPVEIRKASERWKDISAENGEGKPLKFNSWLPDTSIEKLKHEKQFDESPTPIKVCGDWVVGAGSLEDTPSSCMTDGHSDRKISISSIQGSHIQNVTTGKDVHDGETHGSATSSDSPVLFAPSVQCKNKSVRFDCGSDRSAFSSKGSSSESASQNSKHNGSGGSSSGSKPSPYPTPLKLTDEMQTPGTVFPSYTNNLAGRKTKIRSQYVYSVLNPVAKPSEWNESEDEISDPIHLSESLALDNEETMTPMPPSDRTMKDLSDGKETANEASLSAWLKQHSPKKDGSNEQSGDTSGENVHCGRTPGDRPILGMVAAHWNEEEMSHISPKWWDGNGIPNSTNKYKEDQKVSWHATPFEERLEKALSEDTFVSQRKTISGSPPVEFDEADESDAALSHIQSSSHFKSVVSF